MCSRYLFEVDVPAPKEYSELWGSLGMELDKELLPDTTNFYTDEFFSDKLYRLEYTVGI